MRLLRHGETDRVPEQLHGILQAPEQRLRLLLFDPYHLRYGLTVLGDHDTLMRVTDPVHELQAVCFELTRPNLHLAAPQFCIC